MTETAAENFARSLERVADASLSESEHQVAIEDLLTSHARLLRKQGVELAPRRSLGQLISFMLLLAVCVSMALNISWSLEAQSAAEAAEEAAHGLHSLQVATVINQRKGCERGNDDRVGEVRNLRSDAAVERAQLNLWLAALGEASPEEVEALEGTKTGEAIHDNIERLERGIAHKHAAIRHKIETQAKVAVHEGSVRAACKKAYPLHKPAAWVLRQGGDPARSDHRTSGLLELAFGER